jgi:hypothetical protein
MKTITAFFDYRAEQAHERLEERLKKRSEEITKRVQQRQAAWEEVQLKRRQRNERAAEERFERLCLRYEQRLKREEAQEEEDEKRHQRRREFMTFDYQRKWDETEIAQKTQTLEATPWIPPPKRPLKERRIGVSHTRTPSSSTYPQTKPVSGSSELSALSEVQHDNEEATPPPSISLPSSLTSHSQHLSIFIDHNQL